MRASISYSGRTGCWFCGFQCDGTGERRTRRALAATRSRRRWPRAPRTRRQRCCRDACRLPCSLGRILHEMVTGETSLNKGPLEGAPAADLFEASRLPLPLSPLQPCLDGLLGVGSEVPFEQAEDVLVGLLALWKRCFPSTSGTPTATGPRRLRRSVDADASNSPSTLTAARSSHSFTASPQAPQIKRYKSIH